MEEQANYNQVEGQEDSSVDTTVTTSTTKPRAVAKTGKKQEKKMSQTDIRLKHFNDKLDYLAQYTQALEKGTAEIRNNLVLAISDLYDAQYKDCPTFKEIDLNENNYTEYQKRIGLYYKKGDTMMRIIPVEEGWKMHLAEQATYTETVKDQNDNDVEQEINGLVMNFKFEGILTDSTHPTEFQCNARNGHEGILKLRQYLYSLKKDIIV